MANTGMIRGYIQASFDPVSQDIPIYQGSYEFSPGNEQQTIPTSGKALENDIIIRANPYDSNTTDANAVSSEILNGRTAYVNKEKITGTMPIREARNEVISNVSKSCSILEGYHSGEGSVAIDEIEQSKIIPENIKKGITVLGVTGTCEGINTADATATADKILEDETAYVKGNKITGTMPNRGAVNGNISDVSQRYEIAKGYHNGDGSVGISNFEQNKIIAENIKKGVTILGVTGTHEGGIDTSDATANSSEILSGKTAYINQQKITGSMPNVGAVNGVISSVSGSYTVPEGYHNGEGNISIAITEQAKLIPENIKKGITVLGITGTNESEVGVDSSDATALPFELLDGKTAYVNNIKMIGTMVNRGAVEKAISRVQEFYVIPRGFHNGEGYVTISDTEQAKIIPENIKKGTTILGVTGAIGTASQEKNVIPKTTGKLIKPDINYDYLSKVWVEAIEIYEKANSAGGLTVIIGGNTDDALVLLENLFLYILTLENKIIYDLDSSITEFQDKRNLIQIPNSDINIDEQFIYMIDYAILLNKKIDGEQEM